MVEWIQTSFLDKEVKKTVKRFAPQQGELFSSQEVAQFGVNPHPTLPTRELTSMQLAVQDTRTEEEKTREDVEENAAGELFSDQ